MRNLLLCCLVHVTAITTVARGAESVEILSPQIATARMVDHQTIELLTTFERPVMRAVTESTPVGEPGKLPQGAINPIPKFEHVLVSEQVVSRLAINQFAAQRVSGQKLTTENLVAELRKPKAVILLRVDQHLAPTTAKLFQPAVLILHLRASSAPMSVAPVQTPQQIYHPQPLVPR